MAFTLRGVDPMSRLKGSQAWQGLGDVGLPLTEQHKQQAMGFLNYTDQSGETEISGSDYNRLQEEAAKMFGGSFTPWAQPTPGPTPGPETLPWNQPLPPSSAPPPAGPLPSWGQSLSLPPPIAAPPPFVPPAFRAPTRVEAESDPAYRMAVGESQDAIETGAASRGAVFHPNTMRALVDDARTRASDQYDKVRDREYQEWRDTYGMEADAADRNWGRTTDVYDRGVDAGVLKNRAYGEDRAFNLAETSMNRDERYRWADFNQRVNEFTSSDQFRRYVYGTDDEWRRYRAKITDAWQREVADEQRRQFLAELSTR